MKVIIPTFKRDGRIARCVDSIVAHYSGDQIVIVDNGSTDGTVI